MLSFFVNPPLFCKPFCKTKTPLVLGVSVTLLGLTACQPSNPKQTPNSETVTSGTASTMASTSIQQSNNPNIIIKNTSASTASTTASQTEKLDNIITLYTSVDKKNLQLLLSEFSQKTGVQTQIIEDQPMSIMARLQAEGDHSPADMVLTEDVGVLQNGIKYGLLQPFNAEKANQAVPSRFQDTDAHWLTLSYFAKVVVFNHKLLTEKDFSSYADLAKEKWYQKLCVTQASYPSNSSFVVDLMSQLGDKKTQEVLSGYQNNLTMPVLLNDKAVLEAIESGKCQAGLVSSHHFASYQKAQPKNSLQLAWANSGYGGVHTNIMAIALPKNAHQPELALKLAEWLADKEHQGLFASISHTFPVNPQVETSAQLKSWGEFKPSNIAVSEYANKQEQAIELMQLAGYR